MEPILKVSDINVYYGAIHAIKGVSFEVNPGEVVTLIGANGAGKSTTLQTVSGLLHSRTGSIEFLGENLMGVPAHKVVAKGLAQVPEGRHRRGSGKGLRLFPPADGAAAADRRHPLRRRTADAGHGPGADEPSQAADAG